MAKVSGKVLVWTGMTVLAVAILAVPFLVPGIERTLFRTHGFLPHGVCYTWSPGLLGLHVASDALITAAYFSIPLALVYFVRKRADLPFDWIFVLFGIFIIACGATHAMEIWTIWHPHYWLSGLIKAVTAAASVPTAIALVWLIPRALSIPSVNELRAATQALEREVAVRRRAEAALLEAQQALEQRVSDRTRELAVANEEIGQQREWLEVTLASIGDGVIATDTDTRVLLMNEVAESLTGWPESEARGEALGTVFKVIDETSGLPIANPAERAIRERAIVALANYSVLIARDGREIPIDDSAAPIRDAAGTVRGVVLIFRGIGERREIELQRDRLTEALRSANALLDTVFNQAPVGLGLWDRDLRYVRLNDALAAMNGVPREAHIGRTVEEVLPEMDPSVTAAFRTVLQSGESIRHEVSGVTPAAPGRRRWWAVTYYPVRIGADLQGVGAVCEEVTEKREAEAERARLLAAEREARAEAETANRTKDEFLAAVSHELRTPLNSIAGWVHVLERGGLDRADAARALDRIATNVRLQAKLIDDLLDLSRSVVGKLRLEVRRIDPAAVVQAAIDTVRTAADAKSIELATRFDHGAIRIVADPDRLQQVMWNLLSNAIKCTPSGGRVEVAIGQSGAQLELVVRDTGVGIDPAFLPYVFDRFRQGRGASPGTQGGLGLGLTIVRQFVELHGGTVSAESDGPGCGATFTVLLPIPALVQRSAESNAEEPAQGPPRLAGTSVLVVDDQPDARDMLAATLELYGARVVCCADAPSALEAVRAGGLDILVSDIGLPGMDGYGLIRVVREDEAGRGEATLPAIALTAYGRPEDRLRAVAAGFQLHLSKPIEPEELVLMIGSLLGRRTEG